METNMKTTMISLIVMIVTSIIISYFLTMTILLRKNVTHHRNKLYQSLLMASWMGVTMIASMLFLDRDHMKHNQQLLKKYIVILIIFLIIVGILSWWIRQQTTIDQDQFMLGMIEHHQMAIDMANLVKPKVTDFRLSNIVDGIITSQTSEIDQMYDILADRGVPNNIFTNLRF